MSDSSISAQSIPKAQCISKYGETVCGYNCIAQYGEIRCADWPGGACQARYGDIVCGPPAPPNWVLLYQNDPDIKKPNSGVFGAWYVKNNGSGGILRMKGNYGIMMLVGRNFVVEQKMILKPNLQGGYVLDGEVLATNSSQYWADNFYIQQFSKGSISAKNCDDNRRTDCIDVTLTYIGK